MRLIRHPRSCARRSRGVSLIEVLIAMLVLAIGLLGLAALQAQGLKFNNDAYFRSQATILAQDIMDRMRVNRDHSLAANYLVGSLAVPIGNVNLANRLCAPVGDGLTNIATYGVPNDVACWIEDIVTVLPAPNARICQSGIGGCPAGSSAAPLIDVAVLWLDREFTTSATCLAVPAHEWTGTQCLVAQTWTLFP